MPGLSSILLSGGKNAIDKELDELFTTKPTVHTKAATPIAVPGSSKDAGKKRKAASDAYKADKSPKRPKPSPSKPDNASKSSEDIPRKSSVQEGKKARIKTSSGKGKTKGAEAVLEDEGSELENAYHKSNTEKKRDVGEKRQDNDDDDDEPDSPIVHESLKKDKKKANRSNGAKIKYAPTNETPELRDQRTIFVGNLSAEVAQKRPLLKRLQRHILSQVPSAKIESTRFRSVPFQAPTSKLPDDNELEAKAKTQIPVKPNPSKSVRAHDVDRVSTWRSHKDEEGDEDLPGDKKQYLNSNQKKKIAFINQEFHSTADTVNAYVVFAHPVPAESRPANLPPPPDVMDPYQAAKFAIRACDGSLFMDRVIRVDMVAKGLCIIPNDKDERSVGTDMELELGGTDPKSSVFVGNLDFASKEEDLRVFFEGVVRAERGAPPTDDSEEVAGDAPIKKPSSWVSRVRIIRDKDTQLGKGFAYVQFVDHACVDEVLALEATKLKFAKRKLRVQRCRTLPGSSMSTRDATASRDGHKDKDKNKDKTKSTKPAVPIVVPKGDPSLGEKLAHLPKEARKQYKSADADRVARRLAKKKARMAMGNSGVKVLGKEKERERVRKGVGGKKKVNSAPVKKSRVRSEKSVAKRNGKKGGGG